MVEPDWRAHTRVSLEAIEAEIERLTSARDALRRILGVPAPASPAMVPPAGKAVATAAPTAHPPSRAWGKRLGQILGYLLEHGSATRTQIAEALGMPKTSVANPMNERPSLFEKGSEPNTWRLTPEGVVAAKAK